MHGHDLRRCVSPLLVPMSAPRRATTERRAGVMSQRASTMNGNHGRGFATKNRGAVERKEKSINDEEDCENRRLS